MKKTELDNCPKWLLEASTEDEDVTIDGSIVTWNGGIWHDGTWNGGIWRGGVWDGGVWYGGTWCGGTWRGGAWRSGIWNGGTWHGGTWNGGTWNGGTWRCGVWNGGGWHDGIWNGGTVREVSVSMIGTFTFCDGYHKTLFSVYGVAWILAGCRWFTLADAKKHWGGRKDRVFTRASLHSAVALAKHFGLKEE